MPVKALFDEILANVNTGKALAEIHDNCNIVGVSEYRSQQSGKTSIKVTFSYNGSEFGSFMGLKDKSLKITLGRLVKILSAAVGEEKAKTLFNKIADDEDVNSEEELAIALAQKTNAKVKQTPVVAYVDRVKNGEFWDVKWKIGADDKSVTVDPKDNPAADGHTSGADDFLKSFNN